MVPVEIPQLEDLDDVQFAALTAQESYTIEGQKKKMQLVEEMIRTRYERVRQRVFKQLLQEGVSSNLLGQELAKRVQPLEYHHMDLGDGRYNLIIGKGEEEFASDNGEDERVRPLRSILIPAHVDTVRGGEEMLTWKRDARNPERIMGLGVYDMGAAVLNNIALAPEVQVPKGLKAYFAFTVDEEDTSKGARLLVNQWDRWPEINYVLSSEIGPLDPLPFDSQAMRLIIARNGRQKFLGTININTRYQGHGAKSGLPNATDAMTELLWKMKDRFYHGYAQPGADPEPALQNGHPLLGKEEFESGEVHSWKKEGYVPVHTAKFDYAIKTVPPTTLKSGRDWQARIAKGIAKRGRWREFGIDYTLVENPHEASYAPYCMSNDHALVRMASAIMERVSGTPPEICGAISVADECDYAEALLAELPNNIFEGTDFGVITIPINGDHAHHPDEWVSRSDMARVRYVLKMLIEDEGGFRSLLKISEGKQ